MLCFTVLLYLITTNSACLWTFECSFKIRLGSPVPGLRYSLHIRLGPFIGFSDLFAHRFCVLMSSAMACCNCHINIDQHRQSYVVMDLGPELLALLRESAHHEISEHSSLCSDCFDQLVRDLDRRECRFSAHDVNACLWCRCSLRRRAGRQHRRSVVLRPGPEHDYIAETLNSQIPVNGRICYRCWFRSHRYVQRNVAMNSGRNIENEPPSLFVVEYCMLCNGTLFGRRTSMLPTEGLRRNIVSQRIQPREIHENARLCIACWSTTQRIMESQREEETISQLQVHEEITLAEPEERDEETIIPQPEVREEETIAEPEEREEVTAQPSTSRQTSEIMHLNTVKRVSATSANCFVPGCRNPERLIVPTFLRKRLLADQNVYVPKNSRVCQHHKVVYNWEFIQQFTLRNDFCNTDIEDIVEMSKKTTFVNLDFENIEHMDNDHCKFWLGFSIIQFLMILNESNIQCPRPKLALGLYLLKLRTGEPIRRIASLVRMSPSQICKVIAKARNAILNNFVPMHLGTQHLSREALLQKHLMIPTGLFEGQNKAIAICDGTYIYVQKSSNYLYQKNTYSLHKYRNLVKPLLFVATDGYIIDVFGPYGATVSDADIMRTLFQNENHPLRLYFQRGDIFVLDRGFRDSLPLLNTLGYKCYKPESLSRGETQLSTLAANKSRCVTLCRWVVEVVNGRFKRDFKIFRSEYFNLASKHLMDDFRIAAALINSFHPLIQDRPDAALILNRALLRKELPNNLGEYIIENNINRRRANFRSLNAVSRELDMFPRMTMSDLILFSLGIYQIKQARSYYGEHIRQHGTFVIEVADAEPLSLPNSSRGLLIRGRIRSRHQASKVYYTYILLEEGNTWEERINQYYCSCICGKRTVGCCAHTMSIVWFLGWARYEENIEIPAEFLDEILIRENENY